MAAPNFPDTPANNDIYIYNNVEYTYDAPKGSWRSSRLRVSSDILSVNGSANSLASSGTTTTTVAGYAKYLLNSIEVDTECWVRVYTSNASMVADSARMITVDPQNDSGVALEVRSTGANTYKPSIPIYVINNDTPISNNIYMRITNLSGSSANININLTLIKLGD